MSATASDRLEHWRIPALTADRLHLRRLRPGDERFLASLDSDPQVMRYINDGAMSPDEALMTAEAEVKLAKSRTHSGRWIVGLRDSSLIGWLQLVQISWATNQQHPHRLSAVGLPVWTAILGPGVCHRGHQSSARLCV